MTFIQPPVTVTKPTIDSQEPALRIMARIRALVIFACVLGGGVGVVVLVGWALGQEVVMALGLRGHKVVPASTAVAFIIFSIGLACSQVERHRSGPGYAIGLAAGVCTLIIGIAAVAVRLFVAGTPQGLVAMFATALGMSLNTAIALVCLGLSLLTPRSGENGSAPARNSAISDRSLGVKPGVSTRSYISWRWWFAQAVALVAALIGYIALIGYAYNAPELTRFTADVVISIPSAFCLILFGLASFMREYDAGFAAEVASTSGGGAMVRWLTFMGALVVPMIGQLRLSAQQRGLLDLELGLALFSASNVVLLAAALWFAARRLNRIERLQRAGQRELLSLNSSLEGRVLSRTQDLRSSEDRFRRLADTAPAIIWMTDSQGVGVYLNGAGAAFFAIGASSVLQSWDYAVHPDDRPQATRISTQAMAKSESYESQLRLRRADGEYRWMHNRAVPLYNATGRCTGYIGACVDVTEAYLAKEALREALSNKEEAFAREQSLRRELDHRVRNNLAGLLGLVAFYESIVTSSPEDHSITVALRGKIQAMKDVHEVIARAGGGSARLEDLISRLVATMVLDDARQRISIGTSASIDVPAQQAGALAMIVQELITNSYKYGSLGSVGQVSLSWTAPQPGLLELVWLDDCRSQRAPGPTEPRILGETAGVTQRKASVSGRMGMGLRLIQGFAATDLRGRSDVAWGEGWWRCTIQAQFDPQGLHL